MAEAYRVFLASETGKPEAMLEHTKAALSLDVKRPDWVPYVYYWQAVSAKVTGDHALLEQSAKAALTGATDFFTIEVWTAKGLQRFHSAPVIGWVGSKFLGPVALKPLSAA
jgi:hypothetical protein